jgi:hypothetical protein
VLDAVNGDNTTTNPIEKPADASEQQVAAQDEKAKEDQDEECKFTRAASSPDADSFKALFQIVVKLPHKPYKMPITVRRHILQSNTETYDKLGVHTRTSPGSTPINHRTPRYLSILLLSPRTQWRPDQ